MIIYEHIKFGIVWICLVSFWILWSMLQLRDALGQVSNADSAPSAPPTKNADEA